ncbi:MAG: DUF4190 domain-containing protein [Mycobacteriales bacterium]
MTQPPQQPPGEPPAQQPGWPYAPPPPGYPPAGYPPAGYPPQYGYGYGPPPQRPGTNGMAIASMVLGILWIYWIGSILALIFGYIARRQIRERGEGGGGMAIAGIVLGWIGVGALVLVVIVLVAASGGGTVP